MTSLVLAPGEGAVVDLLLVFSVEACGREEHLLAGTVEGF